MTREFVVYGEFLVEASGGRLGGKQQLGLTVGPVRIIPRYVHRDILTDDFGPLSPVEVMWRMGDALVAMELVHYDTEVMNKCISMSMGGGSFDTDPGDDSSLDGTYGPGGRILGYNRGLGTAANMFTTVYLTPTNDGLYEPYRFKACYLNGQPLEIPLGTERTIVRLHWRVVPYKPIETNAQGRMVETSSQGGVVLWDHESDELLE